MDDTLKDGLFNRVEEFANFANDPERAIHFFCGHWIDFILMIQEAIKIAGNNPSNYFIYCDPPYVGTIQDYISKGFSAYDSKILLSKLETMGIDFAISGSCSDEEKEDVQDFYHNHQVAFKEHQYNMNSKGQKPVNEYLVLK